MKKVNGYPPKILVTDAGRSSAVAIMRSLGRKGYRVIAADSDPNSIGFRSRYVFSKVIYPEPRSAPEQFSVYLLKVAQAQGVDLIIPVTDQSIQPIAKARIHFENITRIAIPSNHLLEVVTDKIKTLKLAERIGVPVPKTFIVNNASEALKKSKELGWPVVLKPQFSLRLREGNVINSYSVRYATTATELGKKMKIYEGRCSILLQNYCEGIGYGVELLMYEGQPILAFEHKRLREMPISGGVSAYRESVILDEKLYNYSVQLLKELRWTGLAMVEFKVNNSDAVLMEINGRVWGSLPLAVISGVDFPGLLARLFLNGADSIKPQLDSNYKIGLRCRNLEKDLMWITSVLMRRQRHSFHTMPSRKRAILALLGMLNPRRKFDLLSFEDPLPGLAELPRIARKFRQKMNQANSEI